MAVLELSTSMICPLLCSICPQDLVGRKYVGPRLMSQETFEKALSSLPEGIPLSFAGLSEPYINKATSSMIVHAAVKGRKIMVYTTGVGMSDADVDCLLMLKKDKLHRLMLHLPDGDGDMKANVTPDYVRRVRLLFQKIPYAKAVCFGSLHPALVEFGDKLRGDRVQTRAGNVVHLTTPQQKNGPLTCAPAPDLKNNVLLPSGDLLICCQDYGLRHVIGNLVTQTWDEIHASQRMNDFKGLMREGDCLCRTCEYASCN